MTDERLIELINLEIDGLISREESEELGELTSRDEHAAAIREEMWKLSAELNSLDWQEPPDGFRQDVLARIGTRPAPKKLATVVETPSGTKTRRKVFGYAWAMAAGLLFGLVLASLLSDQSPPAVRAIEATGAIREQLSQPQWEIIDNLSVDTATVTGTVESYTSEHRIAINLELVTREKVEVQVRFDVNDLGLEGIRRTSSYGRPLLVEPGVISVEGTERIEVTVLMIDLRPGSSPVEIHIRSGDRPPVVKTLRIADGSNRDSGERPTF